MIELGLIGYPLGHSYSPQLFSNKFRKLGINGRYNLFSLKDICELPSLLECHPYLEGFNVTIPYKQSVMAYLNEISPDALEIDAVNTVKITRNLNGGYHLTGYNTDWIGFARSFGPIAGDCRTALVLGVGGASHAIGYALRRMNIKYTYVSRNPESHRMTDAEVISYEDVTHGILAETGAIINCTPLGMYPSTETAPPLPYEDLQPGCICHDLVYNPDITMFMRKGAERGATVKNGLHMLLGQADEAWDIWRGR